MAADTVLRADGLPALSLRAVARAAGVTPTAIYTYFTDMADLRNRLGDDFLGQFDLTLLGTGTPAQALRRFLHQVLETIADSPEHVALLASQRIAGPHALALNEALLDFCIDRVGLSTTEAAAATQLLTEWVHGRFQLASSDSASPSFRTALEREDLTAYPRTQQMLTERVSHVTLELLISAITAGTLAPAPAHPDDPQQI